MTSRLKRKLNEIGVDPSSSKLNESFCLIGTPLPPLEKSKDTGEFVPLWKQEVRDEKGRRRLHGAFTGGFSAGYFNTVGSKEGWTPSTFVSSRSDRAKVNVTRPEDFMDDEDLAELRDSKKMVDTHEQTDLEGGILGRSDAKDDSIVSALQAALHPPPNDSPGMKILKRMGWRPGHGIGPKVTYEQRKRQERHSFVPPSQLQAATATFDDNDEEAKKHMYPPINTVVPLLKRKEDSHGLGYIPGKGLGEIVAGSVNSAGKGPNISTGFGLGALNDADEDDLDVYDNGLHQATSHRLAFDDDDDDDRVVMGTTQRNSSTVSSRKNIMAGPKVQDGERLFFKDGRPVLEGFVVSEKPVVEDKWFPLPELPKGWMPDPRKVWENDKENLSGETNPEPATTKTSKGWRKSDLTAGERGSLLGETPLPRAPKSVFDYLSPLDRERLKKMASGATTLPEQQTHSLGVPKREGSPIPGPPPRQTSIPRLDPQAASLALQGFQPFTNDPVKHARYTSFLQSQAQSSETLPFGPFVGQTPEAFMKELEDYVRSAQVFRPVSASMAGRFQSAAVVEVVGNGQEGLRSGRTGESSKEEEKGAEAYLSRPAKEEKEAKEESLSAKDHAARTGMFGPLTREVKPWQPSRLLCKRFSVKDPNPDMTSSNDLDNRNTAGPSSVTRTLANTPHLEAQELLALANTGTVSNETRSGDVTGLASSSGRRDISNIGLGEDETQGRDTLTYKRPDKGIFKAIFASDDENSDEDDEEKSTKEDTTETEGKPKRSGEDKTIGTTPTVAEQGLVAEPSSSSSRSYVPSSSNGTRNDAAGSVDITTFKPTFVPRTSNKDKEKETGKSRSHKKDKKHKTLVSFEVDEDGGDSAMTNSREGIKKKKKDKDKDRSKDKSRDQDERKKRKKHHEEEEDDTMWVERPPPEIVTALETPPIPNAGELNTHDVANVGAQEGPVRGRKRAVDFM